MKITVGIDEQEKANLFLRALWAELRKSFTKFSWSYFPSKDGKQNKVFFGFLNLGLDSTIDISINYKKKGGIKEIFFDGVEVNSVEGLKISKAVKNALQIYLNPEGYYCISVFVKSLYFPISFYKGTFFKVIPMNETEFELTLMIYAYDEIDTKSISKIIFNNVIDILSVETNQCFWLINNKRDNLRTEEKENQFSNEDWFDDYPIIDSKFLISEKTFILIDSFLSEIIHQQKLKKFLNACMLFHTARKYEAQIRDYIKTSDLKEQGTEYSESFKSEVVVSSMEVGIRDSNLFAANIVGAKQSEISMILYISSLEVLSILSLEETDNKQCRECGQKVYSISKRVSDFVENHNGKHIAKFIKEYYSLRSKYVHEGQHLSLENYSGISLPQLDSASSTGCAFNNAPPLTNLQEFIGNSFRKVINLACW